MRANRKDEREAASGGCHPCRVVGRKDCSWVFVCELHDLKRIRESISVPRGTRNLGDGLEGPFDMVAVKFHVGGTYLPRSEFVEGDNIVGYGKYRLVMIQF